MNIQDIINRSVQIRQKYDQLNTKNGVVWDEQDFMSGFVGDVGDLSKIIMAKRGLRGEVAADIDDKLAHELADCLWSVCVLADKYGIDLEAEFMKTMDGLDRQLADLLDT
jgi:NTP pyrophosphatase (non-canonical NTP hydrolase)